MTNKSRNFKKRCHTISERSLVVTCDSVNSLLGNHMKCFNKVIFCKLIFSVKILMYCSLENVACFLRLLIKLNCTLDYFYDGSKHYEPRSDCKSCQVYNILFKVAYFVITGIAWLYSAHCLLVRQRKNS